MVQKRSELASTKKNKRKQKMPTSIQRLYETCKEVFGDLEAGTVPAPEDVNRLKAVLDNMNVSDVGLNPTLPYFWKIELEGNPPITYLRIYECEKFSICIFCLPPKGVIPLHNHPGMTVFSKLLFGNMHVKSCDWADSHPSSQESVNTSHRLAEVKTDKLFTAPCESSVLYPNDGGNMHCFTAMTPCAVLDVLGPPYSDPDGRHCTYYNDLPYVDTNVEPGENVRYTWLEERERAKDFFVLGAKYRGPTIKEN